MKTIFVDFTNGALGTKNVKFHGGGDFCRFIVTEMLKSEILLSKKSKIVCIVNKNEYVNEEERALFSKVDKVIVNSILDVVYNDNDILFLPLIDSFKINIIQKIRIHYRNLRVYCVLHGVRLLDLCKYDCYDKYYYNGIKSIGFYTWLRRNLAAVIARGYLRKYLPYYDRVYTVSNNSMQSILKCGNPKYIKYFTRDITNINNNGDKRLVTNCNNNDYFCLFINANRYEKNFIRTLISFTQYHQETNSDLKMYVTGVNVDFQEKLKRVNELKWDIIKTKVVFYDYLSATDLNLFFCNCSFLVYTSKSEGYGLPPLEAMNAQKPTLASRTTSVPEVLGFAAYYVDPYSVSSIKNGFRFMDNEDNRNSMTQQLKIVMQPIQERGRCEIKSLVNELLS